MRRSGTLAFIVWLAACGSSSNRVADENLIRDADQQYNAAVVRRDLDKIMSFYAADAVSMSPGDAPEHGADAIRAAWKRLLETPDFGLRIVPQKIDVARSGEIAIELGYTDVKGTLPNGRLDAKANYVVGWRKIDGQWKITHETFVPEQTPIPPPSGFGPRQ